MRSYYDWPESLVDEWYSLILLSKHSGIIEQMIETDGMFDV